MPAPLPLQLSLALDHHRAGRLAPAAAAYREILRAAPRHPDALHLLGLIVQQQGDHAAALDLFTCAVAAGRPAAESHTQRGISLRALGRIPEAIAAWQAALAADARHAEAHHHLGNLHKAAARFADAERHLAQAAALAPDRAAIQLNHGVALLELGRRAEAIAAFQRALALQPDRADAHNILGAALLAANQLAAAEHHLLAAQRLQPGYAAALDNLGRLRRAQGRIQEAITHYRAALTAQPSPATHSNLLLALHYADGVTPEELFAEHRAWAARYADLLAPTVRPPITVAAAPPPAVAAAAPPPIEASVASPVPPPSNSDSPPAVAPSLRRSVVPPPTRLRLGYVSPDFVHHAVAFFFEPVLAAHDRTRFDIICYHNAPTSDALTARLRTLAGPDGWRDVAALTDEQLAAQIRADRIDVLIDLAGHTARHRLLTFARRPAPVQLTWMGYPDTTGLTALDARLTDAISDPPGVTDAFHTEKLVRLPGPFSVYAPPSEAPPVSPLPALACGHVTFGSCNHYAKASPAVIALWAQVLQRVSGSHLLLKAWSLADPATADALRAAFAAHGIAAERLEFESEENSVARHLALYHRIDVALDTFPYNGTTTTLEALHMGVPVVTLTGRTHHARVGTSLLTHLGAPQWIADAPESYVAIATEIVADLPRLAAARATLREHLAGSPLCDATTFTRELESVYRALRCPK